MKIKFWQKEEAPQFFSTEDSNINQSDYNRVHDQISDVGDVIHEPIEEKGSIYKTISQWIVLVGVSLLPVFFLPWTTSVLELNKLVLLMAVAGLGLVFWLLHVVVSGQMSWRSTPLDKGVAGFLVATLLATVFSVTRFKSLFGVSGSLSNSLVAVLGLTILYFLVVNLFEDSKKLRSFLNASFVLVLLYGTLQLLSIYVLKFPFTISKVFNTIGSVNSLGLFAAATLPFFWKNRLTGSKLSQYLSFVGMAAGLCILVVLNWWILWAVTIAGMVAMIVLDGIRNSSESTDGKVGFRISKFLFPMTVIILAAFFIVVNLNIGLVKKQLPVEVAPSFGLSNQVAKEVLMKNPAFGLGPENFSMAFDMFGAKEIANSTLFQAKFFDATSEFISLAIGGGLVTLLALAFLLFLVGWSVYRAALKHPSDEVVGALAPLSALLVGLFLYPFTLANFVLLYLMMALTASALWRDHKKVVNIEEKASTSLVSSLGFIGGLILVLIGSYFGANIYMSDLRYAQALTQKDPQKAADLLVQSINWNNQDDRYYRSASQVAVSLLASEINKKDTDGQRTQRVQNYISSAVNLAQRATQVNPRESADWSNLGVIYQNLIRLVDGADKLAEGAFNKATELRPGDPSYYNSIGSMYLAESDLFRQLGGDRYGSQIQSTLAKAEEYLKKATESSPNYGLAIYSLGAVYDRENKVNEAIKQLEKLAPYNGNQPGLVFELGLLYYRAGQKDKAFDQLQKAVVLSPDYANARWYLALIFEERKDFASGIAQLEKILSVESNKGNQVVLDKLAQLQKGKPSVPPLKVIDQKPLQ